jgi:hypothetical protein
MLKRRIWGLRPRDPNGMNNRRILEDTVVHLHRDLALDLAVLRLALLLSAPLDALPVPGPGLALLDGPPVAPELGRARYMKLGVIQSTC